MHGYISNNKRYHPNNRPNIVGPFESAVTETMIDEWRKKPENAGAYDDDEIVTSIQFYVQAIRSIYRCCGQSEKITYHLDEPTLNHHDDMRNNAEKYVNYLKTKYMYEFGKLLNIRTREENRSQIGIEAMKLIIDNLSNKLEIDVPSIFKKNESLFAFEKFQLHDFRCNSCGDQSESCRFVIHSTTQKIINLVLCSDCKFKSESYETHFEDDHVDQKTLDENWKYVNDCCKSFCEEANIFKIEHGHVYIFLTSNHLSESPYVGFTSTKTHREFTHLLEIRLASAEGDTKYNFFKRLVEENKDLLLKRYTFSSNMAFLLLIETITMNLDRNIDFNYERTSNIISTDHQKEYKFRQETYFHLIKSIENKFNYIPATIVNQQLLDNLDTNLPPSLPAYILAFSLQKHKSHLIQ